MHRKISQTMWNFAWCAKFIFATSCGFTRCTKFRTLCEIVLHSILQLLLLLISHVLQNFRINMQNCYMLDFFLSFSSLHLWLACQMAMKCSKTRILHVFEVQLALPWIAQNSSSFFACFNDPKATKNTKTSQKLISNPY